jgi:ribosome recycling factor
MIKDVLSQAREGMDKSLDSLKSDLAAIRTGRASTALVEKLRVPYYGTPTPMQQVAVISVPEPQLIVIRPFDPSSLKDIERGIMQSDLGITPNNDGKVIRLAIPPLTEERRRDLAKGVSVRVEECRVAIRNQRRDALEFLRELEKEKEISEDDFYKGRDELQKITDDHIDKSGEIGATKEQEILAL